MTGIRSVLATSATNKLVGKLSGFSWANVAASAAVDSTLIGESGSGNFFMDVGDCIIGAAAGYVTKEILNNEGSWDNQNVLVILLVIRWVPSNGKADYLGETKGASEKFNQLSLRTPVI